MSDYWILYKMAEDHRASIIRELESTRGMSNSRRSRRARSILEDLRLFLSSHL